MKAFGVRLDQIRRRIADLPDPGTLKSSSDRSPEASYRAGAALDAFARASDAQKRGEDRNPPVEAEAAYIGWMKGDVDH